VWGWKEVKKMNMHGKYAHLFDTEHLKEQLKDKAVRGGFNVMTAEVISAVLRTVSMLILARMLMPEHFGLIGMVTAITTIAERFKDLGLSTATVQVKKITHEQVSALFWINVGFSTLLMFIIAALAWVIAWFFGDHRLVGITLAISSSFFLGGLTVQHEALLRRQMRFGDLAWIRIVSDGLSTVVGIGLAWQGFEYWSLVWKEVARGAFAAAGTWFICRWWPRSAGQGHRIRSYAAVWKGCTPHITY
jgi:O-antigen/teichoic acid export membrane protein